MATLVETIPLDKIKVGNRFRQEYDLNEEFLESIREKGIIQPITVDLKYNLLAGGRRLKACEKLELLEIPAIRRKTTDGVDALEIELFENIHRKDFTWQERAAAEKALLELKQKIDPEWSQRQQARETGVSNGAVQRRVELASAIEAFPELKNEKSEMDAWKKYKKIEEAIVTDALVQGAKARALTGIKIADKNYKIGDVMEGMEKLQDDTYDFAEVDPPYGVDIDKRKSRAADQSNMEQYNEIPASEYSSFITQLASETFRVLKPNSFAVWWFGMDWYTDTLAILREAGFGVHGIPAIWNKLGTSGQTASPDTFLGSAYEPFFVCRKGQPKMARPGRANVFSYNVVPPSQKIHGTEKPQELLVDIIETFTYPGTRMVIPLLGSGATIRACFKTGRIGFGWDLSHEYKKRFLGKVVEDEK